MEIKISAGDSGLRFRDLANLTYFRCPDTMWPNQVFLRIRYEGPVANCVGIKQGPISVNMADNIRVIPLKPVGVFEFEEI